MPAHKSRDPGSSRNRGETGAYNPSNGTYNITRTAYNALGEATSIDVLLPSGAKLQPTTYLYYNAIGSVAYEIYPDGTTKTWTYDGDVRLSTVTDGVGHVTTYSYVSSGTGKSMGWVSAVSFKGSATAGTCYESVYTYDASDNLATIANGTAQSCGSSTLAATTATVTRTYDGLHRLLTETVNAGVSLTTSYAYDNASRVTSITYPAGQGTVAYKYDTFGRPLEVDFNGAAYFIVTYDPYGVWTGGWYYQAGTEIGNVQMIRAYDGAARPDQIWIRGTKATAISFDSFITSFDGGSHPTAVQDTAPPLLSYDLLTYAYDGNGRLSYASGAFSSKPLVNGDDQVDTIRYTYDAVGNIATKTDGDLGTTAVTYTYNYAQWNRLTGLSGGASDTFGYNGDGSLTSRNGWAYTYDLAQGLVQAKNTANGYTYAYAYDGLGRRVKEVDAMASTYATYFAYVGHELAYAYNATSGASSAFVYLNGEVLFRVDSGSSTAHFYAYDMAGNVHGVWSYAGGAIVVEAAFRYKPFGEPATPLVTSSTDPRFKYASQDLSQATNLVHMGARYYAPDLGRFTSRDPVVAHDYAYALNNPVSFKDPSGRFVFLLLLAAVLIGAGFGGGSYAYHVATTPGASWNWGQFAVATGVGALGGAVAGATFGFGAAALGVTSIAELGTLGYGATFVLGGFASLNAYHAEQIAGGAATGHATWNIWQAATAFAVGGGLAVAGKWLGPRVAEWWEGEGTQSPTEAPGVANGPQTAGNGGLPDSVAAFFERQDATLRSWEFYNAPYSDTSAQALGDFLAMAENEPIAAPPPLGGGSSFELYLFALEQLGETTARRIIGGMLQGGQPSGYDASSLYQPACILGPACVI